MIAHADLLAMLGETREPVAYAADFAVSEERREKYLSLLARIDAALNEHEIEAAQNDRVIRSTRQSTCTARALAEATGDTQPKEVK